MAVVVALVFSLVTRWEGEAPPDFLLGFRPVSDLISQPNLFSVIVAVIAGIVGVVSILTTIPAAAAMGLSAAFGQWNEARAPPNDSS